MRLRVLTVSILMALPGLAFAASELDNEIDRFQVELRPAKTHKTRVVRKAPVKLAALKRPPVDDVVPAPLPPTEQEPVITTEIPPERPVRHKSPLFYRFTALPLVSFSTLDGADSSTVSPKGITDSANVGFAGALLTDINLGLGKFVLETGVQFLQTGANTGINSMPVFGAPSTAINDQVSFNYMGLPINAKWMANGEYASTFYAKGGAIPSYMLSHTYSGGTTFFASENRFGGYNSFDVIFDLAVGYVLRINGNFQALVEIGGYQGIMPVMNNYNVFNAGMTSGLGVAYLL